MRDYQPQKGKYVLPNALYHQMVFQIRDYERLKEEYESIPTESKSTTDYDGMPHGSASFDGMDKKIIRMERLLFVINIIEEERDNIPDEYRKGVWEHIQKQKAFPKDADRSTYTRYQSRFIYNVALRQGLI